MLGGLCLSGGLTLPLGLEFVGCSLLVRQYKFTPGT